MNAVQILMAAEREDMRLMEAFRRVVRNAKRRARYAERKAANGKR